MAPIDFSFAHEDVVQKIVHDVKRLSDESLAADKGVHDIQHAARKLTEKHINNITALAGLSVGVDGFAKTFNESLKEARNSASLGVTNNKDFVEDTVIAMVEGIKTKKDLDEAILELKEIANQKPTQSKGFPGAEKMFGDISATRSSDAAKMQKVLGETTDIKKTVEELTKAFAPAKAGYKEVNEALSAYATKIL
ncbi:hypothetical protein AGABI1DRAFT_103407 [Agaricus bisporus var. burnettii JB137-S8]|uniref:Uncharacterized protein n=1 Tax=Agaricus bisporus var. burnettii (strain JB137-S8 / ATCC MYA-4627 / FGSC 10392) TaxID=597362 RepID=K5WV14_AGABU|nr:uncharacterized protein AGABI1DRAFT_103407 [Agaricus bisporus var. burnettii JB137-S8]EKM74588.1 hypothetical protein AGABI1DRAFT_103407 [Agaricus bisporus var. burnettii JB137-S8]